MINNLPSLNDGIKWSWDYFVISWNAVAFIDTWTYYVNGSYNTTTGVYTGGTITGYLYVKYDDVYRSNIVSTYGRKA